MAYIKKELRKLIEELPQLRLKSLYEVVFTPSWINNGTTTTRRFLCKSEFEASRIAREQHNAHTVQKVTLLEQDKIYG